MDRGFQYLIAKYIHVLHDNNFVSSTTQDGSTYDNAVAERINRIMKEEFGFDGVTKKFKDAKETKALMKKVADIYNKEKLHMSLEYSEYGLLFSHDDEWNNRVEVKVE